MPADDGPPAQVPVSGSSDAAERDYLVAELARLGNALDTVSGVAPRAVPPRARDSEPAFEVIQRLFGLSDFERDVLVATAGAELDAEFAQRVAAAHRNPSATRMTLSLALAAFGNGHLSALAPSGPLRRNALLALPDADESIVTAPLRIDERILCYLIGVETVDARIQDIMVEIHAPEGVDPARESELGRIRTAYERNGGCVALAITGANPSERATVGAASAARVGLRLFRVRATDLPADAASRTRLRRLWQREAALSGAALWLEVDTDAAPESVRIATGFAEDLDGFVMISSHEPLRLRRDAYLGIDLRATPRDEQLARWRRELGPVAEQLNGTLDRIAAQFHLSPASMKRARISLEDGDAPLAERLWDACRAQARPRLDELARRVEPTATWDDLVLTNENIAALRAIVTHLRHRYEVYQRWGFGVQANRGLGTGALFAGASGTGKTFAAEVVAREARLDLYQIDLSQVVNKYIGETEKNLRRVFDAAEEGGAILLFDEADALFGKRADVEKGTDRYANIEVNYLLQRMEAYQGLSILTTNMRSSLDHAFLRRLKFVVPFAFPDLAQRIELWRRVFPGDAPLAKLDYRKLACLQLSGGNIRNVALNAAFAAVEDGSPISMAHLLHSARGEFQKLEKPFPEADVRGWIS